MSLERARRELKGLDVSVVTFGRRGEPVSAQWPVAGEPRPARERLEQLIDELEPVAARLGASSEIGHARFLLAGNGAARQRQVAASSGPRQLVAWLADAFAPTAVSPAKSRG